jgi:hypothetical protein
MADTPEELFASIRDNPPVDFDPIREAKNHAEIVGTFYRTLAADGVDADTVRMCSLVYLEGLLDFVMGTSE